MKEIRFLKDLPCKLVNKNKNVIKLLGGDVYYDKDGNRFAYLTLENLMKSPIFFLQLSIREYAGDGKLLQDEEFVLPNVYFDKGQFVNETPLAIDKETEAVEVYIAKATFDKENFEKDVLTPFKQIDYVAKPAAAPKKKWGSISGITFVHEGEKVVKEARPTYEKEAIAKDTPVDERTPDALVKDEEAPEKTYDFKEREDLEEAVKEDLSTLARGTFKQKNKFLFLIPLGATVVLAVAAFIITINHIVNTISGLIY